MIPSTTNTNIFLHVNHFAQRTYWLHGIMKTIADLGIAVFFILLLVAWWYARKNKIEKFVALTWAGLGTIVAVGVNQPIVNHFKEARPYTNLHNILVLAHHSSDYGFPSDHATTAGAVTAGLFLVNPILGVISLIFSLILAFSRVYIGAHYPSDVLAGLALGAAVVFIGYYLVRKPLTFVFSKLIGTPLRPLITNEPVTSKE